jgi:hypothetical protein
MPDKMRKVTFSFSERDMVTREQLERWGFAFREVRVRSPDGTERVLVIPTEVPPPLICFPRGDR